MGVVVVRGLGRGRGGETVTGGITGLLVLAGVMGTAGLTQ